jgi:signal transduction histidine kinase
MMAPLKHWGMAHRMALKVDVPRAERSSSTSTQKIQRGVVQCSIAVLALALITAGFNRGHLNLATVSLLFVIVIVALARVGNFLPSVLVSLLAALLLGYMAPPNYSFRVDDPLDIVAVAAFLITSVIIAGLVSRLRMMREAALSSVNRKLIDAEERVRGRIGKELHDDIEQRLALLAITAAQLSSEHSNGDGALLNSVNQIREQAAKISADVQILAYELRPYKLEYLGIVAAMKSFCTRFTEQHKVKIDFKSHDLPEALPVDTSLCLMRVLQEGLDNSAKHSRARHFEVELFGTSEAIHLTLHDSGIGFAPQAAMKGPGLGLMSMQERLKLVKGEFSIDSQATKGTTIHACVPLSKQNV